MSDFNVKEIVKGIQETRTQQSVSAKDEVKFMRAMLNDRNYEVGVYGSEGQTGTFNPSVAARDMAGSIISGATKISAEEGRQLAEDYEFTKKDSQNMIDISKQFILGYGETGRKIKLGGREQSDVSLVLEDVEAHTATYPKKVGVNEDGSARYENGQVEVPGYQRIRAISPCPSWVKR